MDELAAAVNYSAAHLLRVFKRTVGVTPKAYASMDRAQRIRNNLPGSESISRAAYQSGYGAGSRFYEQSAEVLGMTPAQYRDRAAGVLIRATVTATFLGPTLVAATDRGLCAIEFGDDQQQLIQQLRQRFPQAMIVEDERFEQLVKNVVAEIDCPEPSRSLPLDIQGTAFQRRVWEALRQIPVGVTATYAEVARRIGQPGATRAVAGACSANRLAVVVPCHRVVRADGKPGGYRWGVDRKQALLDREAGKLARES